MQTSSELHGGHKYIHNNNKWCLPAMAATASSGRRATAPPTPATNPKGVDSDGHRGGYGAGVAWTEEVAALMWTRAGGGRPPLMSRR
uniref:Uncharacterized protein n=1 Tax=Oryza sativa subsp. japonica TaxID=39947 RepID=Q5Z5M9_ORYSJ|nr:hypothetical protein [Oryza sativa Japonica Group]